MNIKKCSKCGWECPGDSPARSCPVCRTRFTMGYCYICNEWSDKIWEGRCRACRTKQNKDWHERKSITAEEQFTKWKALLSKQPTNTLTEDQWLDACRHFGGCAYCGSPEIASRSMFVSFKDGGRYTVWNIIPACETCETLIKARPNPFNRLDRGLNRDSGNVMRKYNYDRNVLSNITEYLRSKMEVTDET